MVIINLLLIHPQMIHKFIGIKLCIQDSSHMQLRSLGARKVLVMDNMPG